MFLLSSVWFLGSMTTLSQTPQGQSHIHTLSERSSNHYEAFTLFLLTASTLLSLSTSAPLSIFFRAFRPLLFLHPSQPKIQNAGTILYLFLQAIFTHISFPISMTLGSNIDPQPLYCHHTQVLLYRDQKLPSFPLLLSTFHLGRKHLTTSPTSFNETT